MDGELDYVEVGEASVAYRVLDGDGDHDIVVFFDIWLSMEALRDDPGSRVLLDALRELGRVVLFDRSGIGMSDPLPGADRWTYRRLDQEIRAVISAAGLSNPTIISEGFGAPAAAMLGGNDPVIGKLILFEPYNPWLFDLIGHEQIESVARRILDGDLDLVGLLAPDRASDPSFRSWFEHGRRLATSPTVMREVFLSMTEPQQDAARIAFQQLRVPTLLLRRHERFIGAPSAEVARLDEQIAATERLEIGGRDLILCGSPVEPVVAAISEFITGRPALRASTRSLEAVLITDLGGSTQLASTIGDEQWRYIIDGHDDLCRRIVARRGGRVVKTTGDGLLALLPSATAAIHAGSEIVDQLAERDLSARAGVHVGDVEHRGDDVSGLTVNIASRVMAIAAPRQILLTGAARQAAIGAGFSMSDHSIVELKGVAGQWQLSTVSAGAR